MEIYETGEVSRGCDVMEMTQYQTTRHLPTTAAPHVLACGFKDLGMSRIR